MYRVEEDRIETLNDRKVLPGEYVLYWMQQSQRAEYNHALEYAVYLANEKLLPVVVLFCLTDAYPEANLRHYTFMIEGLMEAASALRSRGIKMIVRSGFVPDVVLHTAQRAAAVVCDRGYLRHQKSWRGLVANQAQCRVVQVESDVVVPVHLVSDKAEYSARTIRPRIHRTLRDFLGEVSEVPAGKSPETLYMDDGIPEVFETFLRSQAIDRSVYPVTNVFRGGTAQAKKRFARFVRNRLSEYAENSNQPQTDGVSHMSPYLHFGQISPVWLAREMEKLAIASPSVEAYLEQLVVRRELAMNFTEFTSDYDSFTCLPRWARKTLMDHVLDRREHLYTMQQLEEVQTHDEYFNAAMKEMISTGFMHNYMRMYWGKKILEWSSDPEEALRRLLYLNNKYFLDGRDPNSYAGAAWIFGMHDRAWAEREIYGKVRYMAASGLERKCDIKAYAKKVTRDYKKITREIQRK